MEDTRSLGETIDLDQGDPFPIAPTKGQKTF